MRELYARPMLGGGFVKYWNPVGVITGKTNLGNFFLPLQPGHIFCSNTFSGNNFDHYNLNPFCRFKRKV